MTTTASTGGSPTPSGFMGSGLLRTRTHRIVGGVAGGLGRRLGIDPVLVRIGFVLLCVAGGVGLLVYLLLWVAVPASDVGVPVREPELRRTYGAGLMTAGTLVVLRSVGLWFGDVVGFSVMLGAVGMGVIWLRSDDVERARLRNIAGRVPSDPIEVLGAGRGRRARLIAGGLFLAAGIALFLSRSSALTVAPGIVAAVAVTIAGLGLFAGPWAWRLLQQLAEERRERIRQEERAEMAAHLHDSVLQTLALIQRTGEAREMVALARTQERELRAWLNGSPMGRGDTIAGALQELASSIELQFKVPVDVITVGDVPLDDSTRAIVDACREACVNAARHSGAERVSVYLEVEPDAITAFVRDEGRGFDPAVVGPDRRGIAESIRGRMERSGGTATVTTEDGEGTEVQLVLPRGRT